MWIKICGITRVDDAMNVVAAGANAIGLNFFSGSPRSVSVTQASRIADAVRGDVDVVGVFVNMQLPQMLDITDAVGLSAVQFHGDESPHEVTRFQNERPEVAVIRALRLDKTTGSLEATIQPWNMLQSPLSGVLIDAFVPGEYGGTGRKVNPTLVRNHQYVTSRLILAGGLTPNNVTKLAQTVAPWGVDTASGVEESPGKKSGELVLRFVTSCRSIDAENHSIRL
jgi:phosphoribosylanthranilate isomerase